MLSACMIEGFGWFPESVYRRTFLLFDQIEYIYPVMHRGLMVPPHLLFRSDITVTQPEEDTAIVRQRIAKVDELVHNASLRSIEAQIPAGDIAVALRVLNADREVPASGRVSGLWAVLYLADKLLDRCELTDRVPVVGQAYAGKILAHLSQDRLMPVGSGATVTPRQASVLHTVAAGLSYAFITDEQLIRSTMEGLSAYKLKNMDLLRRHHFHLLSVASQFAESLMDPGSTDRLVTLRQDALRARDEFDREARTVMRSHGFEFLDQLIPVVAAGLATAVSLMGAPSLEIARAVAPAIGTGVAAAAAVTLGALRKGASAPPVHLSYLIGAQETLESLDGYRPRAA